MEKLEHNIELGRVGNIIDSVLVKEFIKELIFLLLLFSNELKVL